MATPAKKTAAKKTSAKKQEVGFEESLWDAANKLRGSVESAEYKHIVLSLIFLKYEIRMHLHKVFQHIMKSLFVKRGMIQKNTKATRKPCCCLKKRKKGQAICLKNDGSAIN